MCCTVAFVCQVIECQVNPVLILVTEFCIYCKVESGPARNICFGTVTVIFCTRGSTNKKHQRLCWPDPSQEYVSALYVRLSLVHLY